VIVDAHLHVDDIPALGWRMGAELCVQRLDEAGIDSGVVMTIVDAPELNPGAVEMIAGAVAAFPTGSGPMRGSTRGTETRQRRCSSGRSPLVSRA
jgi:hypothetical protein